MTKLAAVLALTLLVGCGPPPIRAGRVIEKHYTPAHIDLDQL